MLADVAGDGFKRGAQVADLGGQARESAGVGLPGAVLADDGAELGVAVEGGPGQPGAGGDRGEGDRLSSLCEFGRGPLDPVQG